VENASTDEVTERQIGSRQKLRTIRESSICVHDDEVDFGYGTAALWKGLAYSREYFFLIRAASDLEKIGNSGTRFGRYIAEVVKFYAEWHLKSDHLQGEPSPTE
jgi:hypothetical protein